MRLVACLLVFAVFLSSALSTPARVKEDECPLITLKDKAECEGRTSSCWSPGEGDVDCPNNGLCCFDGCINQCKNPGEEVSVFVPPPLCTVEYQEQEENVDIEHCVRSVQTGTKRVCTEKKSLKCETVRKPTEWPTTKEECTTQYQDVCHTVYQEWCPPASTYTSAYKKYKKFGKKFSNKKRYKRHLSKLFKKKNWSTDSSSECKQMPVKSCSLQPYNDCQTVTTITTEYEDEEGCTPIYEDVCVDEPTFEELFEEVEDCNSICGDCRKTTKKMTYQVPVQKC